MIVRIVEFRHLLDAQSATRVWFKSERGHVLRFVVQLECIFNDEWQPVVRYDTAHGFAHRDVLHPSGETDKSEVHVGDYNQALTFAIQDIAQNWDRYRKRYEEWLNQK